MNCIRPSLNENDAKMNEAEVAERQALEEQPLAFTSGSRPTGTTTKDNDNDDVNDDPPALVPATSRIIVPVRVYQQEKKGWAWIFLNVEVFEHNTHEQSTMMVFYIPGLCESAETKSVQQMAQWARSIGVKLAVLELQGHGLSSGTLAEMSADIDVLVGQVLLALKHVKAKLLRPAEQLEEPKKTDYVLCGSSFGGTLALYAAEYMSRKQQLELSGETFENETSILQAEDLWKDFFPSAGTLAGVVAVAPAVGVDPDALPPSWMVSTLRFFSSWAPKAQVPLTPLEQPSHYNCPPSTTRNFKGHWPLATSKFMLDLTSKIVPTDIETDQLTLMDVPRVVLVAGAKDDIIPLDSLKALEAKLQAKSKELVVLPKVGHDVLVNTKSSAQVLELIFATLLHGKTSTTIGDK